MSEVSLNDFVTGPIGEPITRPDGNLVELSKSHDRLCVSIGCLSSVYSEVEVAHLGDGSFSEGMIVLAQNGYKQERIVTDTGLRPFHEELKAK